MNLIVTGASRGIGKAIVEAFAADGRCRNIVLIARNESLLALESEALSKQYSDIQFQYLSGDLSSETGCKALADRISAKLDRVDILVNNAGSFLPGNVATEAAGTLEAMMQTNVYSAYHFTKELLPLLKKSKSAHIFNMCSIASLKAYANGGSYSISKFALAGLSKNLREELMPDNIKVTALYPGAVYTDSWKPSGLPQERFILPEDIAALIVCATKLSAAACVEEIVIRPLKGDI